MFVVFWGLTLTRVLLRLNARCPFHTILGIYTSLMISKEYFLGLVITLIKTHIEFLTN